MTLSEKAPAAGGRPEVPGPRRGHLHWVSLDKRRPALVVSPDYRNDLAHDVIIIPCSTRLRPAPTHVPLRRGEGGLAEPSVLKCEQITTLDKAEVHEPLGKPLPASVLRAVERAILRAIGVPVPLDESWR
jgi:mRNA interferase MazF